MGAPSRPDEAESRRLHSVGDTTRCLDDDELVELVEGRVASAERDRLLTHVQGCAKCLALVGAASEIRAESDSATWAERVAALRPGSVWAERYEVRARVGAGGMGLVFRAWDRVLEREVALKVLHADAEHTERRERRLERESKMMARLRHPNAVTVYDVGRSHGQRYVAMEYVEGTDLRKWLDAEARPWRGVVSRLLDAGRGLLAAHQAGIVHRDFKPENVLIDGEGRALVTDFGLAQLGPTVDTLDSSPTPGAAGSPSRGSSLPGAGTFAYAPPEQLRGQAGPASDVFAFCVTAWEALYGRRPFPEQSPRARLDAIERGASVTPSRRVRAAIHGVLREGLAAAPEQRPELRVLLRRLEASASPRRWWWLVPLATLALALVGLAYRLGASAPPDPSAAALVEEACEPPEDDLASLWAEGVSAQIEALVSAAEGDDALLLWSRVKPVIDGYYRSLDASAMELCRAEQREELTAGASHERWLCMDGLREKFAVRLRAAATGSDDNALGTLLDTEELRSCVLDPSPARGYALEDAEERELYRLSSRLSVQIKLGLESDARRLLERARELGSRYYEAVALIEMAREASAQQRAPDDTLKRYRSALAYVERLDTPTLLVWLASSMTSELINRHQRLEEASALMARARSTFETIDDPSYRDWLEVLVLKGEAKVALAGGQVHAARQLVDQALSLAKEHRPAEISTLVVHKASIALQSGELEQVVESFHALDHWESSHGRRRVRLVPLMLNLASVEMQLGRVRDAKASIERAFELHGREVGPGGVVPTPLGAAVAVALWTTGLQVAIANAQLKRADALSRELSATVGEQPGHHSADAMRGSLWLARGHVDTALERLGREFAVEPDPSKISPELTAVYAEALRRGGHPRRARRLASQAYAALEDEANYPLAATTLAASCWAWLLRDQGERERARRVLESALARQPQDAFHRSWAEFTLAVVREELGEAPAELRGLVEQARARLVEFAPSYRYELTQIDAWLAERSGRGEPAG